MMDPKTFVDRYGGVFEHSAFIAERAYPKMARETTFNASNVHVALCHAFREASRDERLGVLKAHPDLAGRLAIVGKLTEQSRQEQAGAGLDRLTREEHDRFTALNRQYKERFGFPFIIAVKGLGKDDILRAFEKRIRNTEPDEFVTSCDEVEKIALHRLRDIHPEN